MSTESKTSQISFSTLPKTDTVEMLKRKAQDKRDRKNAVRLENQIKSVFKSFD